MDAHWQNADPKRRIHIVTTKCGRTINGYDYSYDSIICGLAWRSLRRLRMSKLEVVYIHDPMGVPMDEVMGKGRALDALRALQNRRRCAL